MAGVQSDQPDLLAQLGQRNLVGLVAPLDLENPVDLGSQTILLLHENQSYLRDQSLRAFLRDRADRRGREVPVHLLRP